MRRLLALPLLALGLTGCDDLILLGSDARIDGDYDTLWRWEVDVSGLPDDEFGSCRGTMEVDSRGHDEFTGRHWLPPLRTCLPRRSGRVTGDVDSRGRVRLAVELFGGGFGVFEDDPDCRVEWRDRHLEGRVDRGRIRADAAARYRCWVFGAWRDVYLTLELQAEERGFGF